VFPFHKSIEAHQIAGWAILAFSAVHTAAYLGLWFFERSLFASKVYANAWIVGLALVGVAGTAVALGRPHPLPQRLGRAAELRGNGADGRPLRRVLPARLADQANRPLPDLR